MDTDRVVGITKGFLENHLKGFNYYSQDGDHGRKLDIKSVEAAGVLVDGQRAFLAIMNVHHVVPLVEGQLAVGGEISLIPAFWAVASGQFAASQIHRAHTRSPHEHVVAPVTRPRAGVALDPRLEGELPGREYARGAGTDG